MSVLHIITSIVSILFGAYGGLALARAIARAIHRRRMRKAFRELAISIIAKAREAEDFEAWEREHK